MVVAIAALVVAMTGTGIAAKIMISGAQIKKGTITAAQIKNGTISANKFAPDSIVPRGHAMLTVPLAAFSSKSRSLARSVNARSAGVGNEPTAVLCPNGQAVFQTPCSGVPPEGCPAGELLWSYGNSAQCSPACPPGTPLEPPGWSKTVDGGCVSEDSYIVIRIGSGQGGVAPNRIEIPEGSGLDGGFAAAYMSSALKPKLEEVEMSTPSVETEISDLSLKLIGTPPSAEYLPEFVSATLFTRSGLSSAPVETHATCTFDPQTQEGCTITGPYKIPAGSSIAWDIQLGKPHALNPTWHPFNMSMAGEESVAR